MNGVQDYKEVRFKQTSKGVWYCDGVTIGSTTMVDLIGMAGHDMTEIEKVLAAHNKEAE